MKQEAFLGRELQLYFPPSYGTNERKFPVVYVQDGGYLFDPRVSGSLAQLEAYFEEGLEEFICVGIPSVNRLHEYTPWPAKAISGERGFGDFGGQGTEYLAFVASRLKPYVDQAYRTIPDAEKTAIIGASLGGLIAMYAAFLHPRTFGRIGSISGSYWYEGFVSFMEEQNGVLPDSGMKIYMDVGSQEGEGKQTVQNQMVPLTRKAYESLKRRGFSGKQAALFIDEGANHTQQAFCRRFPDALRWLFSH